ncbi:DUF4240 domain-containing protein [Chitinophaga sp. Cy-1792]|uniref:DUF4240 domain-containing protein n=1 Tax=Chitinophaga sp. Cy-1792 TaxID=2608339 RepID=UPI00141F7121|nr:DUF4240 domain-containing protein [Chitinophaga sp. Cy-1792]NIG53684.1 DUF4240 domain-containing protein [Chitinophaga sp. Cy-1792]
MTEQQFWSIIDAAWKDIPPADVLRKTGLKTNEPDLIFELSEILSSDVALYLKKRLLALEKPALVAFIRIMEAKLHQIDREEIHFYTDGSDDGFLYCRGFIVGMGEEYFRMIDSNPAKATCDAEAEEISFIGYAAYSENFGHEFSRDENDIISGNPSEGWSMN